MTTYEIIADHQGQEKRHDFTLEGAAHVLFGKYKRDPQTFTVELWKHHQYTRRGEYHRDSIVIASFER